MICKTAKRFGCAVSADGLRDFFSSFPIYLLLLIIANGCQVVMELFHSKTQNLETDLMESRMCTGITASVHFSSGFCRCALSSDLLMFALTLFIHDDVCCWHTHISIHLSNSVAL